MPFVQTVLCYPMTRKRRQRTVFFCKKTSTDLNCTSFSVCYNKIILYDISYTFISKCFDSKQIPISKKMCGTTCREEGFTTKDLLIVQVENYERHREVLKRGPYIRHMDLAVSCSLLVRLTPREMTTNRVTWDMLKQWDMSPDEMFRKAAEDSRRELPPIIETMSDVIKGFLMEEFLEAARDDMEQALEKTEKEYEKLFGGHGADMPEIYVISNELKVQGAAVVFYTDILEHFAAEKNSDLILLPSSVHEWLVLTEASSGDISGLEAMVREANEQVVLPEEILSEHVYKYSLMSRELKIVDSAVV